MRQEAMWREQILCGDDSATQKDATHSSIKTKKNKIKTPFYEEIGKSSY